MTTVTVKSFKDMASVFYQRIDERVAEDKAKLAAIEAEKQAKIDAARAQNEADVKKAANMRRTAAARAANKRRREEKAKQQEQAA